MLVAYGLHTYGKCQKSRQGVNENRDNHVIYWKHIRFRKGSSSHNVVNNVQKHLATAKEYIFLEGNVY